MFMSAPRISFYLTLAAALLLNACTDVVKIALPSTAPVLSVDGWLTDRAQPDTILLTQTQNYFNSNPNPVVSGAVLNLTSSDGQNEALKELVAGKYVISATRARAGITYTLNISYLTQQYTGTTLVARSSPRLDSIRFLYQQKGLRVDTSGLYTALYGQELKGPGDHVRFILYRNGRLANRVTDLNVLSDQAIDGQYLSKFQVEQRSPFLPGDFITLQAWSLSPDSYGFYTDLETQLNNGGIFSKTPVNVRCNLHNVNARGTAITGYFGSSLVTSLSSAAY